MSWATVRPEGPCVTPLIAPTSMSSPLLRPLTVEFAGASLGISIDDSLCVVRVADGDGGLGSLGVRVGHRLTHIGDVDVSKLPRAEAVGVLKSAGRPVVLAFSIGVRAPSPTPPAAAPQPDAAAPGSQVGDSGDGSAAAQPPQPPARDRSGSKGAAGRFGFGKLLTGSKSWLKSLDAGARQVVASTKSRLSSVGMLASQRREENRQVGMHAGASARVVRADVCAYVGGNVQALEDATVGGALLSTFHQDVQNIRRNNRTLIHRCARVPRCIITPCAHLYMRDASVLSRGGEAATKVRQTCAAAEATRTEFVWPM